MNSRTSSLTQTESTAWLRPMVRAMFCVAALVCMSTYLVRAQTEYGSIMGYVSDEMAGKGLPFCSIVVLQDGQQVTGTVTDLQGFFFIARIKPDTNYVVIASPFRHRAVQMHNCSVRTGNATLIEFSVQLASDTLTPLIVSGSPSSFISEQFSLAIRDRELSKAIIHKCVQDNDGQVGSIRGTRAGSTDIYIDGVKVRHHGIYEPREPMPVILNGTPAEMENRQEAPEAP